MKHYAVFINGVRGGTITFNNTEWGEELKTKFLSTLYPTITISEISKEDNYYKEIKHDLPYSSTTFQTRGGIGAEMVRAMIGSYEKRN